MLIFSVYIYLETLIMLYRLTFGEGINHLHNILHEIILLTWLFKRTQDSPYLLQCHLKHITKV